MLDGHFLEQNIRVSSEIQAGILTDQQNVVQVGDSLHFSETLINHDFQRFNPTFNRTSVMKYNKNDNEWENIGGPIIGKNVVIADGAKIFGPIIIGENSVVCAGAIITNDIPANSIIFGV